jgi:hypothetical protein
LKEKEAKTINIDEQEDLEIPAFQRRSLNKDKNK